MIQVWNNDGANRFLHLLKSRLASFLKGVYMERIDCLPGNLKIIQSDEVFSYSIDAVLLAHFAHTRPFSRVVDLCAGNGAVGLMLSQKTKGKIDMVEIQSRLAEMAERSVQLNGLEEQVNVIHDDLNNALHYIEHDSVDCLVCNPPYFDCHDQNKVNPNPYLALARHEITFQLEQLMNTARQLLKTKGHLYLVHRPSRLLDIIHSMEAAQIAPKRIQFVYPKKEKEANIVLVEGMKQGKKNGLVIMPPLIVHQENNKYTAEVEKILHG